MLNMFISGISFAGAFVLASQDNWVGVCFAVANGVSQLQLCWAGKGGA